MFVFSRKIVMFLTFLTQFECFSSICFCFLFLDTTVYIPSFDGTSYLELQHLLQPSAVKDNTVILYLTVKTRSTQGTILYSEYNLFL